MTQIGVLNEHPIDGSRESVRWWVQNSLFFTCQLLFPDVVDEPHGEICRFLEDAGEPMQASDYRRLKTRAALTPRHKLLVGARKILKSSIKQGRLVQLGLQNSELRILDMLKTLENAKNDLSMVRAMLENAVLVWAFDDIIPSEDEKGQAWAWSKEFVCLRRKGNYPEPTFSAAGIGKNLTSRHYNVIFLDDIVVAVLAGMYAQEIRPSPRDNESAWGFHQTQLTGLLDEKPTHRGNPELLYPSQVLSLNNRWGTDDYVDRILKGDPLFEVMTVPIRWPGNDPVTQRRGKPVWPTGPYGTEEVLNRMEKGMSTYIWNTQYLCNPVDPAEMVFRQEDIQYYSLLPELKRIVGAMDLAFSLDKSACFTAAVVVGQDDRNNWYVLDAVRGHVDTEGQVNMFFGLVETWRPHAFAIENILAQDKLLDIIRKDMRFKLLAETGTAFFGVKPARGESKDQRIEALQPRFRNHTVFLHKRQTELIQELTRYRRKTASIRDLVDAFAYVPRLLNDNELRQHAFDSAGDSFEDGVTLAQIEREILEPDGHSLWAAYANAS